MIERLVDVAALAAVGALFAGVVWLVLDWIREARLLDDPPARTWPETPGQRNDRRRLLGEQ